MTPEKQPQPETTAKRGRSRARKVTVCVLVAVALFLAVTSVVFVDESEHAIVERFGKIVAVYDRPADRGPHVKLPWPIDVVRRFDRRVQLFDPAGREIFTRDKKNITIDAYVCWRIAEPGDERADSLSERPVVRFFRGLGSQEVAEARLDARVRSILSTEIGRVELSDLLKVTDSEAGPQPSDEGLLAGLSDTIRRQTMHQPGEADDLRQRVGIEIVDVRIKRLNFPEGNQQAVFERMKSERQKIADRYRSAGMAENAMIKSQADRQSQEILARARADAERMRGESEAEAISILNRAHVQDPEFYRVMTTLDAYRKILNERTTLVLSASSNLLKLLTEGLPEVEQPSPRPSETSPTSDSEESDERVSESLARPPLVAPRPAAVAREAQTARLPNSGGDR